MPKVEETLARYISPESSSSAKSPVLPTKPVRTISALVGKAYSAIGQAAACLHTMSQLQAYQAELLSDFDEGGVLVRMQFVNCEGPQICLSGLWQHLVATKRYLWLI